MSIPLDFPNDDPQTGDTYTGLNGTTYTFDGVKWVGNVTVATGPRGNPGPPGPTGPAGADGAPGADATGAVLSGSEGRYAFYGTSGEVVSEAPYLFAGTNALIVGGLAPNFNYYRNSYSADPGAGFTFGQHHEVRDAVNTTFLRTRGANANQLPVDAGDDIADLSFATLNHSGTYSIVSAITVQVASTSTGAAAGDMYFYTHDGGEINLAARITSSSTFETSKLAPVTGTNIFVTGDFIPANNLTYDLGSTSSQWRSLYVDQVEFPDGTTQTTAFVITDAPISSTSTGTAGTLAYNESFMYVCTATNAWQRIAWDNTPW